MCVWKGGTRWLEWGYTSLDKIQLKMKIYVAVNKHLIPIDRKEYDLQHSTVEAKEYNLSTVFRFICT